MVENTIKILLVEDDIDLGNVMKQYLEINDFEIQLCRNGKTGLECFKNANYDLCILDVMMPKINGFTLARHIRDENDNVPFIFLTAKNQKIDRMTGLKLGADDYITKPFEIDELVLRLRNILRRTQTINLEKQQIASFIFCEKQQLLQKDDTQQRLTKQEAKLLALLLKNQNAIVKRADILAQLWGDVDYFNGRSLDVFISRLRKYLKADSNIEIETVRGLGYILKIV
ncbi:MAG: response regulator transcription factor [Chitinophagales bacterium]